MARVAFLGLGAMGSRMARRVVDAGHALTVWNRTPARAEPLGAAGARVAATPSDAARGSEFVITMLANPNALRQVADATVAGLAPESVLIEMSTVGPAAIRELAQRLPGGVHLLDAPVLGSIGEAEQGSLRIFVGGDDALFQRAQPVLEAIGAPLHVGPLGSGAAAKLVANSTLMSVICALGEAIALGDGLGLPRSIVYDVLAGTPLAAQAERRRTAIESGRYPRRFGLSLAVKDSELVLAAGAEASLDPRVASAARAWLVEAEAAGWGELDYSAVLARILGQAKPEE